MRYIAYSTLFITLMLLACQDASEAVKKTSDNNILHLRNVGSQIPVETGMRWMDFYKTKISQQGRSDLFTYAISSEQLQSMMNSVSSLVGVAFHYGIDDLGNTHIVAIPLNETLSLFSNLPGRIYVDANSGETISQNTAQKWTEKYRKTYPDNIWFHFFGANIFEQIAAISYFNSLDIEPAINDEDLTPQLLLIVWNEGATSNGRTADEQCTVYDASNPCPPCPGTD